MYHQYCKSTNIDMWIHIIQYSLQDLLTVVVIYNVTTMFNQWVVMIQKSQSYSNSNLTNNKQCCFCSSSSIMLLVADPSVLLAPDTACSFLHALNKEINQGKEKETHQPTSQRPAAAEYTTTNINNLILHVCCIDQNSQSQRDTGKIIETAFINN